MLTDEQIIKALEYCKEQGVTSECPKCPIKADCRRELIAIALDLIKRQQAEIERLQEIANPKCQQCVEQTRKNSIVEFADELKRRMIYWIYDFQYNSECIAAEREVDNLVKELTEGSK